jgi:hypothetical protein
MMVPTGGFAARSRGRTAKKIDCSPALGSPRTAGTVIRPQLNRGPALRSQGLNAGDSLSAAAVAVDPQAPRSSDPRIDAKRIERRNRGTAGT